MSLAWGIGLLRHETLALGDWYKTFRNNLVSSSSKIKQSACHFLFWGSTSSIPSAQEPSWLGIFMASFVTAFCFITFVTSYQSVINTFLLFYRLILLWGLTHAESLNFHYPAGCYVSNISGTASFLLPDFWVSLLVSGVQSSVSPPLWDCGPVNFFFSNTRARSLQIYW